ncbi:hypothetical protein [Desulfovibrio sp. JC010]|uniref:hypothetical protein n=1 Tax=Desulfovibrio sp. JC010 TaxID=2593641 RepID=UPI0013CF96D9|nr:hypothetical protein [Desulfovibrio sp. JC010]NDV28607.1 hypothetical protein [Desulfovibrio sp. JC010]
MKFNTVKTLFVIVLAAAMLIFATVAHGSSFKFVMENKGKTWELGNNNYLGSIGFSKLEATDTFTIGDIDSHIDHGVTVRFYAGKGMVGYNEYSPLTAQSVFDYTSIAGMQTIENAFYVEFEPKKIRFAHFNYGGHKNLHANGKMGFMESVPAPVPIPATWMLAAAGLLLVTAVKRIKA